MSDSRSRRRFENVGTPPEISSPKRFLLELLDRDSVSSFLVDMNQKTAKLLNKYAELKGVSSKQIKREWLVLNEHQKDQKRQEILKELVK
ncbi:hypothetical protein DLM75_04335 [Leptospira stimsonii]|uniref:Uncharacterized protein n=1 Tax=Leptospira stimsonii TaxID=2202203 RepID=A0A396ZDU0_9LEPT|nr:hypothetical protein DLM75_04335 [Leptospira stimsonii]